MRDELTDADLEAVAAGKGPDGMRDMTRPELWLNRLRARSNIRAVRRQTVPVAK